MDTIQIYYLIVIAVAIFLLGYSQGEKLLGWHHQNLTDGKLPTWRHGRAWLYTGKLTTRLEWDFFGYGSTSLKYAFASDDWDIQFHVGIYGLFSFWLSFDRLPFLHKAFNEIRANYGYSLGISFHDKALWIHFCHNDMWGSRPVKLKWLTRHISVWQGMTYKDYNNWHGFYVSIHYIDMIFGSQIYCNENLGKPIVMEVRIEPEATQLNRIYKVGIQMQRSTWTRSRWPWPTVVTRADMECLTAIPLPGKGENSYDIDDDAIYSMTCTADTPAEAVEQLIESVLATRKRHGLPSALYAEIQALENLKGMTHVHNTEG